MSIQANINQTLSIAGFIATQSPGYQQRAKITELQQQKGALEKRREVAVAVEGGSPAAVADLDEKLAQVQHEIYKTKPSVKAYEQYEEKAGVAAASQTARREQLNKEAQEAAEDIEREELAEAYDRGEIDFATGAEITPKAPEVRDEASETIRQAILSPFSVADEQLQKAIETKKQTNFRKGGIIR